MNRRKALIPVALVGSVGLALTPALAQASTTTAAPFAVALKAVGTTAFGVQLTVSVSGLTSGSATASIAWGGPTSSNQTITITSAVPTVVLQHTYSGSGFEGIGVSVKDAAGDTATNSISSVAPGGSAFTSYGPFRVLDTRSGLGARAGAVAPGGTLGFKVVGTGVHGDPVPVGTTAVILNVTATQGTRNGELTVYGDQTAGGQQVARPSTSNVNYRAGQDVANLVVVPVGPNGVVDFYNGSTGSAQVVADVQGYFSHQSIDYYVPISPVRLLDTRTGLGTEQVQIPANSSLTVQLPGLKGVIPDGAGGVVLNLTALDGTRSGFINAFPGADIVTDPGTSDLNYSPGSTTSNTAIATMSNNSGSLNETTFYNTGNGPVDLIVDAFGYFMPSITGSAPAGASGYVPFPQPERLMDTRSSSPIPTGKPIALPYAPASGIETAAVFNATVTQSTGNGYVSLFPYNPSDPSSMPGTSNLNYVTGQTVPALAIVPPGTVTDPKYNAEDFGLYLGGHGTADVILDEFGYFGNQ